MTLQAQQLSVGYGQKVLVQSASFTLHAGEVLCLLGRNGSGKSTLLRTLLGLLPPLAGQVQVQQKALRDYDAPSLASQIAYVPQAQSTVFSWSVLDAVLFGTLSRLKPLQQPGTKERSDAYAALESLGLAHLAKRNFNTLSGGEQQLVLLARALTQQAPLMILDEPTASLDFANQIQVIEKIQTLRAQGFGILMCTHHSEQVQHCADSVLLLKDQQLHRVAPHELHCVSRLAWLYNLSEAQVKKHLPHCA
ncbi:MAG: hypothetical protein RL217_645 [Pseudomonadota bacterium]|jgi:iron complex transport system ATP-binding protein